MSYFTQTGVLLRYGFSILFCITGILEAQTVQTYSYTGTVQTFTVPACVNTLTMEVWGAQGGIDISSGGWDNNLGGYASAVFSVTPGQIMTIYVGGQPSSTVGGFNGGGSGYPSTMFAGMGRGGGGATDIRTGGTALTDRVLVAGGGGGVERGEAAGHGRHGHDRVAGQAARVVGGGERLSRIAEPSAKMVEPEPAVGIEHDLGDRGIFEPARDLRSKRGPQHLSAAEEGQIGLGVLNHRRLRGPPERRATDEP